MWLSRCDVNDKATLSPHLLLNLAADSYATLKTSHFSQPNLYKDVDFRMLIPLGLALEAEDRMYKERYDEYDAR